MEHQEMYWLALTVVLTALIWMPYILERMKRLGLMAILGLAPVDEAKRDAVPDWAKRMMKAHSNAIENLAVFAPLVLALAALDISTALTVQAAQIYFFARVGHLLVFIFNIPVLRTVTFAAGFACQMILAYALLGAFL